MTTPITGTIRSAYEDDVDHQLTAVDDEYPGLTQNGDTQHGIYWTYYEPDHNRVECAIAREQITAHDLKVAFALTVHEEWESDERNTLEIEAGQEPAQFTPVIYTPRQLRLTAELETLRETLGVEIIVRRMGGMFA